ncbi:DUF6907 domain-containing protein [Nonomuraea sp. NPDC003754]
MAYRVTSQNKTATNCKSWCVNHVDEDNLCFGPDTPIPGKQADGRPAFASLSHDPEVGHRLAIIRPSDAEMTLDDAEMLAHQILNQVQIARAARSAECPAWCVSDHDDPTSSHYSDDAPLGIYRIEKGDLHLEGMHVGLEQSPNEGEPTILMSSPHWEAVMTLSMGQALALRLAQLDKMGRSGR